MTYRSKPLKTRAVYHAHAVVDGIAFGICLATLEFLLVLVSLSPGF